MIRYYLDRDCGNNLIEVDTEFPGEFLIGTRVGSDERFVAALGYEDAHLLIHQLQRWLAERTARARTEAEQAGWRT